MKLQDFIGKIVIGAESKRRYVLRQITAPYIIATAEKADAQGYCASYRWDTINGDPISTGTLLFEDASLTAPFQVAYKEHCRSQDGRWEEYGYWLRRD